MGIDAQLFGKDLFGEPMVPTPSGALKEKFLMPPFSVLNARDGEWQERKRAWVSLGLEADDGTRDGVLGMNSAARSMAKFNDDDVNDKLDASTSIFDPVLCEIIYRWFCVPGGSILDPFAGESTKGIVAGMMGNPYTGCELRQDQVDSNRLQAADIFVRPEDTMPTWVCGDSSKIGAALPDGQMYDLVWTSPPYYDLEIYSESDKDGSAFATYEKFMAFYEDVFRQCVDRMKDNRFLAVKIGEIRDERGAYRNFVGDNITCFRRLGLHYYNELILVTAIGSLPVRTGRQFSAGRKVGKSHQNILVFYKGDIKKIKEVFGDVAVPE